MKQDLAIQPKKLSFLQIRTVQHLIFTTKPLPNTTNRKSNPKKHEPEASISRLSALSSPQMTKSETGAGSSAKDTDESPSPASARPEQLPESLASAPPSTALAIAAGRRSSRRGRRRRPSPDSGVGATGEDETANICAVSAVSCWLLQFGDWFPRNR